MGFENTREMAREAEIEKRTEEKRRELVTRSAIRAVPMNIINAIVLSIFMLGYVAPLVHGSWLIAMGAGAVIRLGAIGRARRQKRLPTESEMKLYIAFSAFVGTLWGIVPFLLSADAPAATTQAVAVVIAGMTAGSALTSAADQRVVTAYNLPAISLFSLSFILQGGLYGYLMAAFVVLFFFITRAISTTYSNTLSEAVRTNVELDEARRETEEQTTALSNLAERHEAAARSAEEQTRTNAAVLANMSHELSTPLNGVLGMSQLLMDSQISKDARQKVKRIHESGESLSRLLTDILDVSRIEAGRLPLVMDDISVEDLANWANRRYQPIADVEGLNMDIEMSGDVGRSLRGDERRIQQIMSIFMDNAFRFTDQGGVTVNLSVTSGQEESGVLRIEIRDTGAGVPESARDNLFNAFSAESMDETIRQSGTGLGLHLAHKLSGMMNGQVGYEPLDKGSVFWVEMKLKCSSRADRFADNERLDLTNRRLRILVAEADKSRQMVFLGYLKSFNCVVTCVSDGQELQVSLNSAAYDAVVIGASLEGCSSEDAAADIRGLPSTASMTPIIRFDPEQSEPIREFSGDVFVRLPVESTVLMEALRMALEGDPTAASRLQRIA